jgi:endonuclease/exonuclease/phosphatase family metal-dependent hydrolase
MLKVMTLNLNGYGETHGAWRVRRDLIVQEIEEADPEVVAFQAVRREPQVENGLDQAAQIARQLSGYPYVIFEPVACRADGGAEGLAFLSRQPVIEAGSLHLTLARGAEDPARRMVFQALFSSKGSAVRLFNAHLSWIPEQNGANVHELLAYLRAFEGPALLVGDFNAPAGSDALRPLQELGWSDLWAGLRSGEEGFTFPSDQPERRIDFIWASGELAGKGRAIEVRGLNGSRKVHLSDHLALLGEVETA